MPDERHIARRTEAGSETWTVRRVVAADWPRLRDLRLEMLADTPIAYLETLEQARRQPDEVWRERAATAAAGAGRAIFVAETARGKLVGQMVGLAEEPGVLIVAVYVAPAWRGDRTPGVAAALLDAVGAWARDEAGADELNLLVHERNARAIAFYRRAGFVPTGHTEPYPLDPSAVEIGMSCPLRRGSA